MDDTEYQDKYDEYVRDILPAKCGVGNKDGVEPDKVCKLYKVIKPIFDAAEKNDECLQCTLSNDFRKNYDIMADNIKTWFKLIAEARKSQQALQDEKIGHIVHLMNYMVTCESLYTYMADWFCFIVVKAGDPKNHGTIHQTSDMSRMQYQHLGRKLSFLKQNKLGDYTSVCRTEVRNAIAHFSFEIRNNQVCIRNEEKSVDVEKEYGILRDKAVEGYLAVNMWYDLKSGTLKQIRYYQVLTENQKESLKQLYNGIVEKTPPESRLTLVGVIDTIVKIGMETEQPFENILTNIKKYCGS